MQTDKIETTKKDIKKDVDKAVAEVEQIADEVRVKLHLMELDARDVWEKRLEPLVFQARVHAKEASAASKAAVEATLKAIREFADSLQ